MVNNSNYRSGLHEGWPREGYFGALGLAACLYLTSVKYQTC